MSQRLQGFLIGGASGAAAYLWTYKDLWTSYESVAQGISKLHYTINPNVIPLPKSSRNEPTTWLVGYKEESRQAGGRTPTEAYNERVRTAYRYVAEKCL